MIRLLCCLLLLGSAVAVEAEWNTGWTATSASATLAEKPILADFTGSDWCGWCIKLKKEVFDTDEFKAWAADHVVLMEVDFPQNKKLPAALAAENEKLSTKYKIEGFPTVLFLDAKGKQLGQLGYKPGGPKAWIAAANEILAAAK